MQEVKREVLVSKASELLNNGTVDRVLGWKTGEFDYDITPAVFYTAEELERDFVWNDFCDWYIELTRNGQIGKQAACIPQALRYLQLQSAADGASL